MAEGFVDLFDNKADDIRDGVNFLVGKELLDFEFIHSESDSVKI